MEFFKNIFRKRSSASVVRQRLKQVLATDRLNTAPGVIDKIKQAIISVLSAELGEKEMIFDISSNRLRGKTELAFNITFTADIQKPAA